MNQESIGKFIAALRKEKKLTQKQFAEILGVNDRSISRWENGYCMPDLSLLQIISEELDVSVSELLSGRRISSEDRSELSNTIDTIIELSNKEKQQKAKKINCYFIAGMLCLVMAILHYRFDILSWVLRESAGEFMSGALTILGMLFEFSGFYHNQHDKTLTKKELELLLKSKRRVQMKTAQEMMRFAEKYHEINKKQYRLAFTEIENDLKEGEIVVFSAIGASYTRDELPMMWHVAFALTKDRIIIAGERVKGMVMTSYMNESFPVCDIISIDILNSITSTNLIIRTVKDELKIEVGDSKTAAVILRELQNLIKVLDEGGF